ncbi:MAG: PIN domain-containing protein [Leptospiraceae bacterium]|nr:PIN domain-containing protein [Leptospiraceae bacterium]
MSIQSIFLDEDIVFDLFYERGEDSKNAKALFSLLEEEKLNGFVSSNTIFNLFNILEKNLGAGAAKEKLIMFRSLVKVLSVESKIIDLALNSKISKFENAIHYFLVKNQNIRFYITNEKKDFPKDNLVILNTIEFLKYENFID